MLHIGSPRWRVRLVAAGWVAVVAAIPAYIAAGAGADLGAPFPGRLVMTLSGIAAAVLSGHWIGWRLIDPQAQHAWDTALWLATVIWLLAYYLLAVLLAVPHVAETFGPVGARPLAELPLTIFAFFGSTLIVLPAFGVPYGIMATGWYTLPVALIAGYILSRRYRRCW